MSPMLLVLPAHKIYPTTHNNCEGLNGNNYLINDIIAARKKIDNNFRRIGYI